MIAVKIVDMFAAMESVHPSGRDQSVNRLRKPKSGDISIEILNTFNPAKKRDYSEVDSEDVKPEGNLTMAAMAYLRRSNWLRAAILGANDGLVSIASLMMGIGAVSSNRKALVITGLAGWIAGACSMGIGEFVSVYSQRDLEVAQIKKERQEHQDGPEAKTKKLKELASLYVDRGLSKSLAKQVALELSEQDAVKVHAREKLLLDEDDLANPFQAAVVSTLSFSMGAIVPLLSAALVNDPTIRLRVICATTTLALAGFGAFGARMGDASILRAALRVTVGGWASMGITFAIVSLFDKIET